jgi:hypothetical protein
MNKTKRGIIAIINFVALFGAIVTAGMLLMHRVPKQSRTPEEYRSRIEQITSIEKMQAIAIDDDEYIRTLENLAMLLRRGLLLGSVVLSLFAVTNLLLIPWKAHKHESSA